jgi:diacylglycerol kinase (ATP)
MLMRAAAVLGLGITHRDVAPFQLAGVELTEVAHGSDFTGYDAVLIFGGDGTLHHQLPGLVKSRAPVLVVPTGSGNDFASACGVRTRGRALETWKSFCHSETRTHTRILDAAAIFRPEDLSKREGDVDAASGIFFCNAMGIGLDARANQAANRQPRWLRKHGGYFFSALGAIALYQSCTIRVLVPDTGGRWKEWLHEPATLVAVANNNTYGGGIRIAPEAQADDGKLDLCFVRASTRWDRLTLFPKVIRGKHLSVALVEYTQTERLRIETARPMDCYADGEFACQTPIEIRVLPRALEVITAAL